MGSNILFYNIDDCLIILYTHHFLKDIFMIGTYTYVSDLNKGINTTDVKMDSLLWNIHNNVLIKLW